MAKEEESAKGTIFYPDSRLKKAIKLFCVREGLSMTAFICEACQEKIDKREEEKTC